MRHRWCAKVGLSAHEQKYAEKTVDESVQSALYATGDNQSTVALQMEEIEARGKLLRETYAIEVRQKGEFFDLGMPPAG